MQLQPPTNQSSTIVAIGHDPATDTLVVQFKSGGAPYAYSGVPAEVHAALLSAESAGKYFHAHIKGKYEHSRYEGEVELGAAS